MVKSLSLIILGITMTPFYLVSYVISVFLKLKGYEDMESPNEWFSTILSVFD